MKLFPGVPSDELEVFLLQELTAKGLKKFGNSVELSYSTIQKLVLRQLNIVGQSLTYYLAELRGLTRIPDRYKVYSEIIQTCFNAMVTGYMSNWNGDKYFLSLFCCRF